MRRTIVRISVWTKYTKLLRRMGKETHTSAAVYSVLTRLRTVATRVEPALENTVSELATVAFLTVSFSELRTCGPGVTVPPGISPAGFLCRMSVRTVGPIVRPATSTLTHLKLVHPETITGVRLRRDVEIHTTGARPISVEVFFEVTAERGVVSEEISVVFNGR